jgi:hypothetical protein
MFIVIISTTYKKCGSGNNCGTLQTFNKNVRFQVFIVTNYEDYSFPGYSTM